MANPPPLPQSLDDLRLMRRPEVEAVCGVSRSLLYDMVAKGAFPQPLRISSPVGRMAGGRGAAVARLPPTLRRSRRQPGSLHGEAVTSRALSA